VSLYSTGATLLCACEHKGAITSLQVDSSKLVSGSFDHSCKVWSLHAQNREDGSWRWRCV